MAFEEFADAAAEDACAVAVNDANARQPGEEGAVEVFLQFFGGLIDGAPTKLTVPYSVARAMFVEGNQQAAMQAFMSGQIKVEGDMTKLMAMQGQNSGGGEDMQKKLQEITAPD